MSAPAGLGRLVSLTVEAAGDYRMEEGSAGIAAGMPLGTGGFSAGAGAGWNGNSRQGIFQISGCYVVAGDPIGFMEGLFGPSITTGVSASVNYSDSTGSAEAGVDAGFQFSLFPSFALGMNWTDVTGESVLRTGFSHVFNRNLIVHANYGDDTWQCGGELTVSSPLKIYAGTDGKTLNSGFSLRFSDWLVSYGAEFSEESIEHGAGVSRRFP